MRQNKIQKISIAVVKTPSELIRKNNILANYTRNGNKSKSSERVYQGTAVGHLP